MTSILPKNKSTTFGDEDCALVFFLGFRYCRMMVREVFRQKVSKEDELG